MRNRFMIDKSIYIPRATIKLALKLRFLQVILSLTPTRSSLGSSTEGDNAYMTNCKPIQPI